MPNVFSIARRLPTSECENERPKNFTFPPIKGCKPTMCRNSVLLPQPDRPIMKNISPRATLKLMSFNTTSPSYPAFRCSTSIARPPGSMGVAPAAKSDADRTPAALGECSFVMASPAQHVEHDREESVGDNNEKN